MRAEWTGLVAGDGFGGLLGGLGCSIAIGWSDGHWLPTVGKTRRDGLGDILHGADLHDGLLGLLQHQFFVDGANLSLFFVSLLAARAVFFGGGQGNVVFEMAHASGVF